MSDDAPRRRHLDDWRAAVDAERREEARKGGNLIALWAGLVLVLTLLYVMIGSTPYLHERDLDPLTGAATMSPINRTIWLSLLVLALPILWFRRGEVVEISKRLWPLLLAFAWFAATSRWALDPAASSRRLFLYIVDLIICVAVVAGLRDARRIHFAMAVACLIVMAIDLGSWIFAPGISMTDIGLAAIHTHKNTLGAAMLFSGLVISPYLLFPTALGPRLFWSAMFLICVALLIASLSKTSMALLAAFVVLMPLLMGLLKLRAPLLRAAAAAGGLTVLGLLVGWTAFAYATGRDPLEPIAGVTFTQRTDVWAFALDQFAQHPLKGLGFGSFWDIDPKVQPSLQSDAWFAQPDAYTNESHNGYIDLLVTTGLPGLAVSLFLLVRWGGRGLDLLRQGLGSKDEAVRADLPHAVFLAVFPLVFFVHNWMESSYFTANAMFGIIILLVGVDLDMRYTPATPPPEPRARRALDAGAPRLLPPGWRP
ncbi:O-antigen ligase family protein [Caulobacter hibisci]|uniref:O-antigen ligase family protein n=1 Tax=Caulobacter hibisci TaxID=2035993 RepID=A0ABS0ST45_9CAUL|nr:O-antigen ligase family protein [Caulobacter hibisci]MBI1682825.1 O-antigen ligase family protein [Caulobacter hibisci]